MDSRGERRSSALLPNCGPLNGTLCWGLGRFACTMGPLPTSPRWGGPGDPDVLASHSGSHQPLPKARKLGGGRGGLQTTGASGSKTQTGKSRLLPSCPSAPPDAFNHVRIYFLYGKHRPRRIPIIS